jgi:phage shock protein PspC (stress-responsive transcriptional regulator)
MFQMSTNRLVKDEEHGVWAGVLAGLANHLDLDPALVRIVYCIFTLASGLFFGFFVYIIMMLCIPSPEDL